MKPVPPTLPEFPDHLFTPRERQVMACIGEGKSRRQIAAAFGLTQNTVKDYLKSIYAKAEVHSARELLVRMCGVAAGASEASPEELLQWIERLQQASGAQATAQALTAAVQQCCHATHAGVWRWVELSAGARLMGISSQATVAAEPRGFYRDVREQGMAQQRHEQRHLLGLRLQVEAAEELGPTRRLPAGPTLLVAWREAATGFSELECCTCRLLARVAEMAWRRKAGAAAAAN